MADINPDPAGQGNRTPSQDANERIARLCRLVAAIGGVLAIMQAGLLWEHVNLGGLWIAPGGPQVDWVGAEARGGQIILVIGIAVLAVAGLSGWRRRLAPGLVLVLGILALLIAVAGFARVRDDVDGWNSAFRAFGSQSGLANFGYEFGPGVYVGLAATTLIVLAGILGFWAAGRADARAGGSGPIASWMMRRVDSELGGESRSGPAH